MSFLSNQNPYKSQWVNYYNNVYESTKMDTDTPSRVTLGGLTQQAQSNPYTNKSCITVYVPAKSLPKRKFGVMVRSQGRAEQDNAL